MIVAIIPARSGSKRIKNKNVKRFNGKKIIKIPITELKKTKLFDHIYVSTDSNSIAKQAKLLGAEIPFLRSKSLADDKIGIIDVVKNFLDNLKKKKNIVPSYVCCVLATAVFFKKKHILKAFKILKKEKKIDYVFSAHLIENHFFRSFKVTKNKPFMLFNNFYKKNSQDLPDNIFIDSGQFYFAKTKTFLKKKKIFQKSSIVYKLDNNIVDINTKKDWKKAEAILKNA